MKWHEHKGAGMVLRLVGLGLLTLAWLFGRALRQRALAGPIDYDAPAYLFAALAFISASAGAALTFVGPHLFDLVEISTQWRRRDRR